MIKNLSISHVKNVRWFIFMLEIWPNLKRHHNFPFFSSSKIWTAKQKNQGSRVLREQPRVRLVWNPNRAPFPTIDPASSSRNVCAHWLIGVRQTDLRPAIPGRRFCTRLGVAFSGQTCVSERAQGHGIITRRRRGASGEGTGRREYRQDLIDAPPQQLWLWGSLREIREIRRRLLRLTGVDDCIFLFWKCIIRSVFDGELCFSTGA